MDNRRNHEALWQALDQGNPEKVLEEIGELSASAPVVELTLRGLARFDYGEFAGAEADFRDVLKQEPENPVAKAHLALALFRLGQREESARLLKESVLFPHSGFIRRFLEVFWPLRFTTSLGKVQKQDFLVPLKAKRIWQKGMERQHRFENEELEPDLTLGLAGQINDLFTRHFTKRGRRLNRIRVAGDKLMRIAIDEFFAGRRRSALEVFRYAYDVRPLNPKVREHLAYLLLLEGQPEEAQTILDELLQNAIERFDDSRAAGDLPQPDALVCYAWCRHELGAQREAIHLLSAVHPEGPEDFGSHFVAAMSWLMIGHDTEFREALRQALGPYFIDTWEQIVRPFILKTQTWLESTDEADMVPESGF